MEDHGPNYLFSVAFLLSQRMLDFCFDNELRILKNVLRWIGTNPCNQLNVINTSINLRNNILQVLKVKTKILGYLES